MAKGGAKKAAAAAARAAANRMLADNRQARHQYEILETLETGIELVGTEVKSIRNGKANLRDGFCLIRNGELQLHNVHISPHTHAGSYFNHDPLRTRKLLAHRREIDKLRGLVDQKGLTLIPQHSPQGILDQAHYRAGQRAQVARQARRRKGKAIQEGHESSDGALLIELVRPKGQGEQTRRDPFVGDQHLQRRARLRSNPSHPQGTTLLLHLPIDAENHHLHQRCAVDAQDHGITC